MAAVTQVVALLLALSLLSSAQAGWLASNGYHEKWMFGQGTWYGDPYGEGSSGKLTSCFPTSRARKSFHSSLVYILQDLFLKLLQL